MAGTSVYDLLCKMQDGNIVLAYKGEINADLLESVYSMMDRHFEEKRTPLTVKKKFFQILIESLQNVLHHQFTPHSDNTTSGAFTGFAITTDGKENYSIVTGNLVKNTSVNRLKEKLDEVNSLSPEALRSHYQQSLAGSEFSDKGGAGLGIIEMARKSGNPLKYEFTAVNDEFSFFCLTITIPHQTTI